MQQNTTPATTLETLQYELNEGSELNVCFLFDTPRSRNWVGTNQTVQIADTMSFGVVTFVTGLIDTGEALQYVRLILDTRTGEGIADLGRTFSYEDRLVIETTLALVNEAARGIPSAI